MQKRGKLPICSILGKRKLLKLKARNRIFKGYIQKERRIIPDAYLDLRGDGRAGKTFHKD